MTGRPNKGKDEGKQEKGGGVSMTHLGPGILSVLCQYCPSMVPCPIAAMQVKSEQVTGKEF